VLVVSLFEKVLSVYWHGLYNKIGAIILRYLLDFRKKFQFCGFKTPEILNKQNNQDKMKQSRILFANN
jgi:hypothetical protein